MLHALGARARSSSHRTQLSAEGRFSRLVLGCTLVVATLLATHQGEFWPFSIFPMFAKAGRPWTHSLTRDVTAVPPERWMGVGLAGAPFALENAGIEQNDLASLVRSLDERVSPLESEVLAKLFEDVRGGRRLLLYSATGALDSAGHVGVEYRPRIVIDSRGARDLNVSVQ